MSVTSWQAPIAHPLRLCANDGFTEVALNSQELQRFAPECVLPVGEDLLDLSGPEANRLEHATPRALRALAQSVAAHAAGDDARLPPLPLEHVQETLELAHCYNVRPLQSQALKAWKAADTRLSHPLATQMLTQDGPAHLLHDIVHGLPRTWWIDYAMAMSPHARQPEVDLALCTLTRQSGLRAADPLPFPYASRLVPTYQHLESPFSIPVSEWSRVHGEATVLCLAVADNHVSWAAALLESQDGRDALKIGWEVGGYLECGNSGDAEGSILDLALHAPHADMTRLVLDCGASSRPSLRYHECDTVHASTFCADPLLLAVESQNSEKVSLVLKNKKNIGSWGHRYSRIGADMREKSVRRDAAEHALSLGLPDLEALIPMQGKHMKGLFGRCKWPLSSRHYTLKYQ